MKTHFPGKHAGLVVAGIALVLIQFTLALSASAQLSENRPAFASLPKNVQVLVLDWLNRDCGADEKMVLERRLQAIEADLEPVFWEAYRLGPSLASLERDRTAIGRRYETRQAWLAKNGRELFGTQDTSRLLETPKTRYVAKEMDNLIVGYKTAAILGLGLVGTRTSLPDLNQIAGDAANPAAVAAKQTITSIESRGQ